MKKNGHSVSWAYILKSDTNTVPLFAKKVLYVKFSQGYCVLLFFTV